MNKVWMLGMPLMKEELESHGIEVKGEGGMIGSDTYDKPENHINWETLDQVEVDPEVKAVV